MSARVMSLAAIVFTAALVGGPAGKVVAQSFNVQTYCEINLRDAGLDRFAQGPEVKNGSVFTFATKKCTNSKPGQTINLTCTRQLTNWTGGTRSAKPPCKINLEQCGVVPGGVVTVSKANLDVSATGLAVLVCQFNRNR
jgi:type 1 fimbria pilin